MSCMPTLNKGRMRRSESGVGRTSLSEGGTLEKMERSYTAERSVELYNDGTRTYQNCNFAELEQSQ